MTGPVGFSSPLARAEVLAARRPDGQGRSRLLLSVPGIRCGSCVAAIERTLSSRADVASARANLTLKRVSVVLESADADPSPVIDALTALGFPATPVEPGAVEADDPAGRELVRALAIAGFGAMNIMLLSVGVWSGAEGRLRLGFHILSALIALPVVAVAGRPFFRSAIAALRAGRMNMDVPIALGVSLAVLLSLFETAQGGAHVFFDAAVTLLFFLLAGRWLDHLMRERARSAVTGLARLSPAGAMVRQADGTFAYLPLADVRAGDVLSIAEGEPVPVDIRILDGHTDLDRALVTGEAMPVPAGPGFEAEAGTRNLTGTVQAQALRSADASFLAQMIGMQAAAEGGRGRYVRIADRAARLYAPVVHVAALATFAGWLVATAGDWQTSAFVAISVLIITCPCALGLAVPVAHVVAAGQLMRRGVLMKDGAALERLAEIDRAVFDKTGTLTTGLPRLGPATGDAQLAGAARALALRSRHPASRAIAALDCRAPEATDVTEVPGSGVEGTVDGKRARLGRADWVGEIASVPADAQSPVFGMADGGTLSFALEETLRPGAAEAVRRMTAGGLGVTLLSGDTAARADLIAGRLGIGDVRSGATPAGKIAALEEMRCAGGHTLMVGDGLNDAPALAAAHVSMAPGSGTDAGRTAADFVLLRDSLAAVPETWTLARDTARIVRQNFALAVIYNCAAIPLAVAGLVTPLVAALAMSGSSILVTLNALRLNRGAPAPARMQDAEAVPA